MKPAIYRDSFPTDADFFTDHETKLLSFRAIVALIASQSTFDK